MGLQQKWDKVQLPQKAHPGSLKMPSVKFGGSPSSSFREMFCKWKCRHKIILVYGSAPKVDQSTVTAQTHSGPLKIQPVKFGSKSPSSFGEKLQKCKSEFKGNFGLSMGLHQKWAKIQLIQKAHLRSPKVTPVLNGWNPSTTFRVLDQNREQDVHMYGQTDSPHWI